MPRNSCREELGWSRDYSLAWPLDWVESALRSYPYSLTRLLPLACYNSTPSWPMPDTVPLAGEAVLEVISPDGARRYARITQTPFMIGRGAETGNHLQLSDRRISRNCAAVVIEANRFYIEDRGQRRGLFVNGEKVDSRE